MNVSVLSRAYDNFNSGVNPHESILTAEAVATRGIKRLYSVSIPGDARGAEAQPLVLPSLMLDDGQVRDLHITATMANQVAATDMNDGTLLWSTTVGRPVLGTPQIDAWKINMRQPGDAFDGHWGILSTPVIHPAHPLLYACVWSSPDGSVEKAGHSLVEVSLRTGRVTRRLDLEGAAFDPGGGLPRQQFRSAARKQRASLKIHPAGTSGAVLIPFGSIYESSGSNRGWLLAVDIALFRVSAAWCSAVNGSGGGIWQAGAGPTIDTDGSIYVMTGNGDFDAKTEWGECFLKLRYSPPASGTVQGSLTVVDWWSPFLDDARGPHGAADEEEAPEAAELASTNVRKYALADAVGQAALAGDVPLSPGAARDLDLGSGGPVIVGDYLYGAGKDGVLYTLHKANMGKTQPEDLKTVAGVRRNYARCAAQPIWFTFYPGPQVNPAPDNIADLNYNFGGLTHHQHGSPLVWKDAPNGPHVFCFGENSQLRAWQQNSNGSLSFIASGEETASPNARLPPGGMPGGFMCLSYDSTRAGTAVLWATIPYGDANREVTKARLLAYNVNQYRHGPNGAVIPKIWDSQDFGHDIDFVKFTPKTVANGRLCEPNYSNGEVCHVYGLG